LGALQSFIVKCHKVESFLTVNFVCSSLVLQLKYIVNEIIYSAYKNISYVENSRCNAFYNFSSTYDHPWVM